MENLNGKTIAELNLWLQDDISEETRAEVLARIKKEQARILREALGSLRDALNSRLADVPEYWDGIEIKSWLADYAAENFNHIADKHKREKRRVQYHNDIRVKNLT